MHVSGLPPSILWWKTKYFINWFFKSKYGGGRPENCINVRFRTWNACLCMFPVFHYHILIWKIKYFINCYFLKELRLAKNWDTHKLAFQGLKRTLKHVSGLPPPYFDFKNQILYKLLFFKGIMVGEEMRHA